MREKGPASAARGGGQGGALRFEAGAVFGARRFDAPDHGFGSALEPGEADPAAEGERLFRGVEDLQEAAGNTEAGEAAHCGVDLLRRVEEIADEDRVSIARQPVARRQAGAGVRLGAQGLGEAGKSRGAAHGPPSGAEQRHPFAAAEKQRCDGEQQQRRALLLGLALLARREIHRRRAVAPQPDALRRFPLAFSHIEARAAGGLSPIDCGGGVAGFVAAELPECFAGAGPAASVHPLVDGGGDAARGDEQGRQRRRGAFGAAADVEGGGAHRARGRGSAGVKREARTCARRCPRR